MLCLSSGMWTGDDDSDNDDDNDNDVDRDGAIDLNEFCGVMTSCSPVPYTVSEENYLEDIYVMCMDSIT